MKRALVIGNGWVANNRHKPILSNLGISVECYDKKDSLYPKGIFDFSVICTPPQERLSALRMANELGIKFVYLEKPLATSLNQAAEIMEFCQVQGIEARSCHNFIFSNVGQAILHAEDINSPVFLQLNRVDRKLPNWIDDIPFKISLDEFPHFGYLARALYPSEGLRSNKIILIESVQSPVNMWQIQFQSRDGYVICDLWRDQVYRTFPKAQKPYWQYWEEFDEGFQRIKGSISRVVERVVFRRSNSFGTLLMWTKFLNNQLTEQENFLTSIDLSREILVDFFETRSL